VDNFVEAKELASLLKEHGNTPAKLYVLLFWGIHPQVRFTIDYIADAFNIQRFDLEKALRTLNTEDIIVKAEVDGVTNYLLN